MADVAVGASSADFLQFEVGGRSAGMAGAHTGLASGVTAQFWNPAALSGLEQPQVGVMHASWLGDLSYEWVGYARPAGRLGIGSISVAYFHMPSIQGVDEFDNPTESFRVYDLAVTLGLARPVARGVSVGANVKMIRQNLATVSATGAAVDLGATAMVQGTTFGVAAQNMGPDLSYGGTGSYPLPRQIRLGAGRGFLENKLLVAADYNIPRDYYKDVRVGSEYKAHRNVSLRLGYRHTIGSADDPATGLSYGFGLRFGQLDLDYALTPSDGFDNVHRFALGYSFGSGAEEPGTRPEPPKKEKPLPPPPPKEPTTIASATKATKAADKAAAEAPVVAKAPEKAPAKAAAKSAPAPKVVAVSEPAPEAPQKSAAPAKPAAKVVTEFAVLLPGYQSKNSAQAEIKALQLLGFRTKNAEIVSNPEGGYSIRLAQMKSKSSAEDMVSDLSRMSFRAVVQTVQR